MNWFHLVDPAWLAERKKYLTASDVKKLIPITATGRPRTNLQEAYMKVWADKQCLISEDDVSSSGVMARGHLLEPYAIAEFNKLGIMPAVLCHWDDMLIYSEDDVSCSPDALDVERPVTTEVGLGNVEAYHLGEVKAYSSAMHYLTAMSEKMTLEERWQIATAFYCIPTLKSAALILFNPSAAHPLFYHLYTRLELKDELDMVDQVVKEYRTRIDTFKKAADSKCPPDLAAECIDEEDIIDEIIEKMDREAGLNP